jgi:alkylation response protein AidB-like acyl-CoA dehydrogenase
VLLQPSADQEFFRETTDRYLTDRVPVDELRRLRDDEAGFGQEYWRGGAELGWTSPLVAEEHGGGTISGDGLVDLTLVAYEFGRHAAPGPLVPTNVVAKALSDAGSHRDLLADIVSGAAIVSWCDTGVEIRRVGDELVVSGVARPVESAMQAGHFLVSDGITQAIVPAERTAVTPMQTVDLTKRFGKVTFDGVRVPADAVVSEGTGERLRHTAIVLTCAEAVGAMQAGFEMTVAWAFDRYSFGRPLASYQELKHRFADMKTWLEASHAVADGAAEAVSAGTPDASELVSVAKAYIGQYGSELLQDCIQMHGGIGVTFDHDIHLFLRRHTLNRTLHGTPAEHRQLLGASAVKQVEAVA